MARARQPKKPLDSYTVKGTNKSIKGYYFPLPLPLLSQPIFESFSLAMYPARNL